ncbi:hypothetical protein FF1_022577 [Malus domestica]
MGSSGFEWSFLKLPFREKKESFHLMIATSNTFGRSPLYLQHPWSGGLPLMTDLPTTCGDKSGFIIIHGEDLVGGSSTKLMLAAQPDHLIGFNQEDSGKPVEDTNTFREDQM